MKSADSSLTTLQNEMYTNENPLRSEKSPRAHQGSGMTIPEFHQLATEIGERSQYLGFALS